jgi:hypothetical protein
MPQVKESTAREAAEPLTLSIEPERSLEETVALLEWNRGEEAFVIDREGRPLGTVTLARIRSYLAHREAAGWNRETALAATPVVAATDPRVYTADADTPLNLVFEFLRRKGAQKVLVCEGFRILGQIRAPRLEQTLIKETSR